MEFLQQESDYRCRQEETFWRQKSRINWIEEGERNTRFFDKSTMKHRAHNRIIKLLDTQGEELKTHKEMELVLLEHFKSIAMEILTDRSHSIKHFTKNIPKMVTREDNYNLNRPVTEEEVKEVIKEMHNGKAPGSDGFNVDFFKACWNIVKQDILNVVEDSRNNRTIWKVFNTSFISLIPKQDNDMTPYRFRPIALCNVVYKILSKVIENRLKPLLAKLVSQEQEGFVEGRKIMDNIIHAHEPIHTLKL